MRQRLCLILAMLMTVSSLVSCSGSGNDQKDTAPSSGTNTDTTTVETETPNIYEEAAAALPKEKYADKTFTILTREEVSFEMDAESSTGEITNDAATINGKLYTAAGDIAVTSILYSDCMFFNAALAEENGMSAEALQDTVFNKGWTIDYFNALVADLYTDVNGDGVKDESDFYGFATSPGNPSNGWLTAFDQAIVDVGKDGKITINLLSDKTISALEKMNRIHWEEQGVYNPGAWDLEIARMLVNRNAIFTLGIFNDARTKLAAMEDDFGILPYPMWDEAQGTYYTGANDQFTVMVFPIDTQEADYEYLGTILEALAIESARTVRPAFYNSALKNRYSMDANTAKIIDLIMEGRRFDFSFQYGNDILVPYMFRNQIIAKSNDLVSVYEKSQKTIETKLAVIAGYYGLE